MNYRISPPCVLCLYLVLSASWLPAGRLEADESESAAARELDVLLGKEQEGDAGPPTHTVTRELVKIDVELQGVIEAEHMEQVTVEPEAWNELKVIEAVEHGTRVRKGEPLVRLETKSLDEAIEELESARQLSRLSLEQKKIDIRHLTKTLPMDVRAKEITRKQAREDLDDFLKIGRPESEKSAEFMVKKTRDYLEYEKEELRQLEKMYGADDLTEETEEIVLKRQRDAVESAIFSLERAQVSRDRAVGVRLPRQEESLRNRADREELASEKAKLTLPMMLEKQQLELASLEHGLEKTEERLEKLRNDRGLMTIVAPSDGVVYYGQFVRGKWSGAAVMASKLRKGGLVPKREVLMTVVQPHPFLVRATVPEKELGHLNEGSKGRATPTAYSETGLPAKIRWLSDIPVSPGNFEALIELGETETLPELLPGMTCAVRFTPYENREALTVPARALFTDEKQRSAPGGDSFVFVLTEGGEHERRVVKTGRTVEGKTEILEGLKPGDRILLERPKGE